MPINNCRLLKQMKIRLKFLKEIFIQCMKYNTNMETNALKMEYFVHNPRTRTDSSTGQAKGICHAWRCSTDSHFHLVFHEQSTGKPHKHRIPPVFRI